MKKNRNPRTPRPKSSMFVLRQICNLIPDHLVKQLSVECGVQKFCRTVSAWSHVVALIYAQLTHAIGLNDVCDGLRLQSGKLSTLRGATPVARNTFSHANKVRPAQMAEQLFWKVLDHLNRLNPHFTKNGRSGRKLVSRFRRSIHIVDSTVLELVANCMDWAKHRRRKAAAKCHLRLNLESFLPAYVLVDTAKDNDAKRAREVCAGVDAGEIVIFDRAYVDFDHLFDLYVRGVFWVTRTKSNLVFKVLKGRPASNPKILADEEVIIKDRKAYAKNYPERMRRIRALVVVDNVEREMEFLTNNLEWSPQSVADLYKSRWEIEVFFKQIKQTLKLSDFLGNSANAVRWQVWTALLVYVLLRFHAFIVGWNHSFTRLFTLIRSALWEKLDLMSFLRSYGTAAGHFRARATPESSFYMGEDWFAVG